MTALPHSPIRAPERTATTLLALGAFAGPVYVVTGAAQAALRPGFDIRRLPLSMLSNGELGWIQIANFLVAGTLTIVGAAGVRRALRGGVGGSWGPRLLALYGAGLLGAGVFLADPALGFPPGTPAGPGPVSWHGTLHFVVGGIGFVGFIGACPVLGRVFARRGHRGWANWSRATGVVFLAAFAGIAAGGGDPVSNLAFTGAVLLGWAWQTATLLRLRASGLSGRR